MKEFILTVTVDNKGALIFDGHNDGFTAPEIVAFLEIKKQDIIDQITQPDRFVHKRTFVNNNGEEISVEEVEE
jgi:hypothetical protein